MTIPPNLSCWCGNSKLTTFSPGYFLCPECQTLVSEENRKEIKVRDLDEEQDFYGRNYWFDHQEQELGFPNIRERARSDLPERCLYWLKTLLKYKTPPGKLLELGCGHGGLVALLQWAGFDAVGLELSPWVVDFARKAFGIPVLSGPLEDQTLPPASQDAIILMDVLEHLADPSGTLQVCESLLTSTGILLIQTPCLPENSDYGALVKNNDPFLKLLQPREHLYLFSRRALEALIERQGPRHMIFEPAYFGYYDQFVLISSTALPTRSPEEIRTALESSPGGRLIQALLDLSDRADIIYREYRQLVSRSARPAWLRYLKKGVARWL